MLDLLVTEPLPDIAAELSLMKSVLILVAVAVAASLLILGASYIGVWWDDRRANR